MDTTYRKNLKAVLTASKNYTDNSIEKLKWELGTYDLSVTTDSTVAYTKTIPTNAIKGKLNYIGGASKVSENLILEQKQINLNPGSEQWIQFDVNVENGQTYTLANYEPTKSNEVWQCTTIGYTNFTTEPKTFTVTTSVITIRCGANNLTGAINYQSKIMLVKGTTAPTEFKQGFDGIHSAKTTSVVVSGTDVAPITKAIPSEIQALEGYGLGIDDTCYNYVDLINKKFINKTIVLNVKITSIQNAIYSSSNNLLIINNDGTLTNYRNFITNNQTFEVRTSSNWSDDGKYSISVKTNDDGTSRRIDIRIPNATSKQDYVDYFTNNPLTIQYAGMTPVETDISQYIDDDFKKFALDNNYTNVELINEYNYDIPNKLEYYGIIKETLCPSVSVAGANRFDNTNTELVLKTFNNSNQTIYSYAGFGLKVFNLTIGQTYTISTIKNIYIGETNSLNNSGTTRQVGGGNSYTFTATTSYLLITNQLANQYEEIFENLMIEVGSTAHYYRPHKDTITRNFPTITSDGYGVNADAHNLRVFSDYEGNAVNKRYTNVNKGDLGSLDYTYNASNYQIFASGTGTQAQLGFKAQSITLTKLYTYATTFSDFITTDKCVYLSTDGNLYARDSAYTDATIFKTANVGNPLYYELADASKTEDDIDDFDYFFDVEEGDVITFNNPYAQQVYATYSFIIKEAKSNE